MSFFGAGLGESSKKTYLNNLKKLNDKVTPTDIKFLKDTESILAKIALVVNPNTRRSYYIAVVSALKDKPKFKKEYDIYHGAMNDINQELNKESFKSEKTKTKIQNINMEDVHKRQSHLNEVINEIGTKRKITDDQYARLHDLVIVSLYTLIAPRRVLDYSCMVVGKPTEDKELNYYFKDKMYFNNYKTKGAYNQQVIDIPKELQDILKVWIKHKRGEDKHILLSMKDTPYDAHTLSRCIPKIFASPSMGISVLRNVYLTSKYGELSKQMSKDATEMGTSVGVVNHTYIK